MKTTKFQRITALILLVMVLIGTVSMPVSAAPVDSDESELSNIKELLNAISYNEYKKEYTSDEELKKLEDDDPTTNPNYFDEAPNATKEIILSGLDGVYVNTLGDVLDYDPDLVLKPGDKAPEAETPYKFTDGVTDGLYIPDAGTTTWTIAAGSDECSCDRKSCAYDSAYDQCRCHSSCAVEPDSHHDE